jgi:hypothetical protein
VPKRIFCCADDDGCDVAKRSYRKYTDEFNCAQRDEAAAAARPIADGRDLWLAFIKLIDEDKGQKTCSSSFCCDMMIVMNAKPAPKFDECLSWLLAALLLIR